MMRRLSGRFSKRFAEFDKGDPTKAFELIDCLGEGTYGMVWTATELRSGRKAAVKIVPIDNDLDEIKAEISVMRDSQSDYVIKLFSSYVSVDKKHIWMAMEVCEAGSVNDLMFVTDETLTLDQLVDVTAASAMGLAYLHKKFIIHRDIKCGNILLNARGQVKLADFGVSALLNSKQERTTTAIGAPFWMAPEVIQEEPYDGRADVWSLGITVIEMAESRPPNSHIHPMRALFVIPHQPAPTLQDPGAWPDQMVNFVTRCLTKKIDSRFTSKEACRHPFIESACKRLNKRNGCSATLERLVQTHLPAIEEFRAMEEEEDSDDSDEYSDDSYETDSEFEAEEEERKRGSTHGSPRLHAVPPPPRTSSAQTLVELDESRRNSSRDSRGGSARNSQQATGRPPSSAQHHFAPPREGVFSAGSFASMVEVSGEKGGEAAPGDLFRNMAGRNSQRGSSQRGRTRSARPKSGRAPSGRVPSGRVPSGRVPSGRLPSERRLAPIRPTSSRQSMAAPRAAGDVASARLKSRALSANLDILPKSAQNKMQFDDVRKLLEPSAAEGGRQPSVRNPNGAQAAAQDDNFASTVMTKQFINLLKKSKAQAPDMFEMLSEVNDPTEAMEVAIAALRIAVGKGVIKRSDSDGGRGSTASSSGKSGRPAPRPAPRAPPRAPSRDSAASSSRRSAQRR